MDTEHHLPSEAGRERIRRIGAYRFFALVTLPAIVLLCVVCVVVLANLRNMEEVAGVLRREYLTGILESQRTLINLEILRRNAETVYVAEDPRHRRTASLHAQALAVESVFETVPHFANFANTVQHLIRELAQAKKRSADAADALHNSELVFSSVLARLFQTFGWPNNIRQTHSARHVTTESPEQDKALYQSALKRLEPLLAQCRRADLAPATKDDCAQFTAHWEVIGRSWEIRSRADHEARAIWRRLERLLQEMSDATSTAELKRTYTAMERLGEQTRWTRVALYFFYALLVCIGLSFLAIMHRHILRPIALAAGTLQRIRFGLPTSMPLPPVRIRELQDLLDLLPSLSEHLSRLSARSSTLEQEKNRYAHLSLLDALTGVGNRRGFDLALRTASPSDSLALLMIDVDMFKAYNDRQGHQAGDACLAAVAQAMQKALFRSGDRLFRYGGEEFAVLLPDVTEASVMVLAERMVQNIRDLTLPHPASPVGPYVTVSIGAAFRAAEEALDDAELVDRADKALYQAKNSGRNQACLYVRETEAARRP